MPLIIRVPWTETAGKRTDSLVELVDLYPTLASLAGLPEPMPMQLPDTMLDQLGSDLSPLFKGQKMNKTATFSQFPNCGTGQECMACTGPASFRTQIAAMGYSIRTDKFRYTEYVPFNTTYFIGNFSAEPLAKELYDHTSNDDRVVFDFDNDGEVVNHADDPKYKDVQDELRAQLVEHYSYPMNWLESKYKQRVKGQNAYAHSSGWVSQDSNQQMVQMMQV